MPWRPRFNITCGRCGKPREGFVHVCVSNSTRKAVVRPQLSFGKCGTCGKPYGGNPLTHVCKPKSDFRRRRSKHERQQKAKARKRRQQEKHDFQACQDRDCPRPLCVAFRAGWKDGYDTGIVSCPLPHQG